MVKVSASMHAAFGSHIYITIKGNDKLFEYRAINLIDAKRYVERIMKAHFPNEEIEEIGEISLGKFIYGRQGD